MTRLPRKGVAQGSAVSVLVVLAILVPVFAADPASTNLAVFIAMYVGLATAWNIMGGYTGYISLGHAAFFGFGAYSFGLVLHHLAIQGGYEPFVFIPVAGVLTALLAVVMGWVALRTRAATFVIVTIAMMFMIQLLAENLDGLTGGGAGLAFPIPPWSGDFYNDPFYYAMLVLALVSVAIGAISDCSWAFAASAVRAWFARSPRRIELVGGAGGLAMIGVGVTVAFTGRHS